MLLYSPTADNRLTQPAKFGMVHSWQRKLWALTMLARYGTADAVLSFGGGLGDQLLLTTIAREFCQRNLSKIWIWSGAPELFKNNPDIRRVITDLSDRHFWFFGRFCGKNVRPTYVTHILEERRDIPPEKHLLAVMCEQAGIKGRDALRPYLNLTKAEESQGRLFERQIVVQSTGKSSQHFMLNKEWYPERFQEVVNSLKGRFNFIQVGSLNDPRLEGAHDLRGKTSLRETAALMKNSLAFLGLVGFPMHLARAVDCRSVIVYGGRELPAQSGYLCNINLTGQTPCAPCWRYDECPGQRSCMDQITSSQAASAMIQCVERHNTPLETECPTL